MEEKEADPEQLKKGPVKLVTMGAVVVGQVMEDDVRDDESDVDSEEE